MHCSSSTPSGGLRLFIHTPRSLSPLQAAIANHPLANCPMSPTSLPRQPGSADAGVARHAASFKVHRDSHIIHKQATTSSLSSGSTNSSVSSSSNGAMITSSRHHRPAPAPQPPRRQQPVIIYTHSPKVIRANPHDFMSIVQTLTGLDSHGGRGAPPPEGRINSGSVVVAAPQDESSSSSSESCANNTNAAWPPPYAYSQLMPPLDGHFMAPDIPLLFAPDAAASDLHQLYGQFPPVDATAAIGQVMSTNMNSTASNGGAVFSPSMVETVRTFAGYHNNYN